MRTVGIGAKKKETSDVEELTKLKTENLKLKKQNAELKKQIELIKQNPEAKE